MALSRALRDVMRGENGFAGKKTERDNDSAHQHAKGDQVKISRLEKEHMERKRANPAQRYRGD